MSREYTEGIVLRLSQALEAKLAAAAKRRCVSVEALAHETLERALDYDDWFIGKTLTHEAVRARLAKQSVEYASIR